MAARAKPQPTDGCPLTPEDVARCEEALRQLQPVKSTLEWCERCKIPVESIRRDYEDLTNFFTGILQNSRGPQSPITGSP